MICSGRFITRDKFITQRFYTLSSKYNYINIREKSQSKYEFNYGFFHTTREPL